ncbi:MAG: hypothetical protein ACI4WH_08100 [Oscillospiraceae bacterium]
MKKLSIILALSMSMCLLAACGSEMPSSETLSSESTSSEMPSNETLSSELTSSETLSSKSPLSESHSDESTSSKSEASSQSVAEGTRTDVLYAVFSDDNVKEYPLEYTGDKKTPEELADELSELVGLDFIITASKTNDGLIVDWSANSTLVAGLDNREQKKEFFFFDQDSLCWFMMDSLWRTLTENLDTENIYYTMNGGKELVFKELYPINEIPSDTPYMGSQFYFAHADVKGDVENTYAVENTHTVENAYARTNGLWRLDGATDTASIEMDGLGNFTMYYASGTIENTGYLECTDEYGNGDFRYDMYNAENELIASFYFDSDTQFHIGNDDGTIYILDTQIDIQEDTMENPYEAYWGYWGYPDGTVLEIREETWYLYENNGNGAIVVASGPVEYDEEAAYLMNEDGSSGGGKVSLDENNNLVDSGIVLTHVS